MRAWIEMMPTIFAPAEVVVALLVRAWIEMETAVL